MNCPSHCLIYLNENRSYRDLPLRYADFGVLHRNEVSGALSGLTRVRKFSQDDAHIFCREDQIESEIKGALEFLKSIYDRFGFSFQVYLSTRPEKFMGDPKVWDQAEASLQKALESAGLDFQVDPQGGAFYGPKIDIKLKDSLGRDHQCGTIQLDFQQPINFNLQYRDPHVAREGFVSSGEMKRPVIIHRAIYGSFERFIAILLEHYQGRLPLWLSPRQFCILPVSEAYVDYAYEVHDALKHNYWVDVNADNESLKKRIRSAEQLAYNFIIVVGQKEEDQQSITVRCKGKLQEMTLKSLYTEYEKNNINFQKLESGKAVIEN